MVYHMTTEDNILFAKRNVVDSIYKEAKLEGVGGTFLDTKQIYEGGVISGMKTEEIVLINNLKHAWQFVFDTIDVPVDIGYVRQLNSIVGANLNLLPGEIRSTDVSIGGTTWKPDLPEPDTIKAVLQRFENTSEPAEHRILGTFTQICKGQWFYDGNKRTAQLIANKELIANGAGILAIPEEHIVAWEEHLLDYYVNNDEETFVSFLIDTSIDGIDSPLSNKLIQKGIL